METDAYFMFKSPDIKLINQTVSSSAYLTSFFFGHSWRKPVDKVLFFMFLTGQWQGQV